MARRRASLCAFVLGSYSDALGAFRVDARLVDVETGEIVKSVGANGKVDDFLALEQTLAEALRQAAGKLAVGSHGRSATGSTPVVTAEHRRVVPKPPKRLKAETALDYGRALVATDDGHRKTAQMLFRKVLSAQPDFELAQRDLGKLIQ